MFFFFNVQSSALIQRSEECFFQLGPSDWGYSQPWLVGRVARHHTQDGPGSRPGGAKCARVRASNASASYSTHQSAASPTGTWTTPEQVQFMYLKKRKLLHFKHCKDKGKSIFQSQQWLQLHSITLAVFRDSLTQSFKLLYIFSTNL